jgi:hypothetical protein
MEKSTFVRAKRCAVVIGYAGPSASVGIDMRQKFYLALATVSAMLPLGSAAARIAESGYSLPLPIAVKAAASAIASCAGNGYPVSAVVVDTSGVIKLEVRATIRPSTRPRRPTAKPTPS